MITLIVKSGLGNQIFQYAFARALQEEYKENGMFETFSINPYYLDNTFVEGNEQRKMSLNHLVLNSEVTIPSIEEQRKSLIEFKKAVVCSNSFLDLVKWKLLGKKPLGEGPFVNRSKKGVYYTFNPYTFYGLPLSNTKNKYIFGFFQDPRNFSKISHILKKECKVQTPPSSKNTEVMNKILNCNSVCLHIRRGDYLNDKWKSLQICGFEYYNNAINRMIEVQTNPVFFVFSNNSDDIQWIKDNYRFYNKCSDNPINLFYVDLNNPDYEEYRLMYSCKNFILSNSTFSWWAAYVCDNDSKTVIVPKRWNLAYDNDTSIYLPDWIKI